jgi:high-affinity Fe2+/Pb2+ permease
MLEGYAAGLVGYRATPSALELVAWAACIVVAAVLLAPLRSGKILVTK